ncbi:hypothetical protein MUP59_04270 [Candidatus Bathyarchaeota archaeon]|nr:hypothetical protein [Candidatus Bathyarchaeota archaeon]
MIKKSKSESKKGPFDSLPDVMEIKLVITKKCYIEWNQEVIIRNLTGSLYGVSDASQVRILLALSEKKESVKLALKSEYSRRRT